MTTSNLTDELIAIPGVADAEVTLVDEAPPVARVWLDGSRGTDEVREKVEALLGREIPAVRGMPPSRRSGLGKGLDALMPDLDVEPIPKQLKPASEARVSLVARVAVVESDATVTVEIEDGAENVFTALVDDGGSIDDAVLRAVMTMTGTPADAVIEIADVDVGGVTVLVVTASMDGRLKAGASPVDFGRPFALARAARQALAPT